VTITGTNLLASADPATTQTDVRFAPYAALAAHTTPNAETPTRLSMVVPSDAADGPIRVSTFNDVVGEGAVLSGTAFQVPPPDVSCPPVQHARSITLSLRKHLVARGKVSVGDGFNGCAASVPVKVQRRISGQWRTVERTTTTDTGATRSGSGTAQASTDPWPRRSTCLLTSVHAPSHPFGGTARLRPE